MSIKYRIKIFNCDILLLDNQNKINEKINQIIVKIINNLNENEKIKIYDNTQSTIKSKIQL